jgi:hypothetical protein
MLADHLLVRCPVDAVDFVIRYVAVDPLNLKPKISQYGAGCLRGALQVRGTKLTHSRHLTLDHKLRHLAPRFVEPSECSVEQAESSTA